MVLQVTPRLAPCEESKVSEITLFAVTAVVFTTTLEDPAGTATNPSMSAPQVAGEDEENGAASQEIQPEDPVHVRFAGILGGAGTRVKRAAPRCTAATSAGPA